MDVDYIAGKKFRAHSGRLKFPFHSNWIDRRIIITLKSWATRTLQEIRKQTKNRTQVTAILSLRWGGTINAANWP